MSPPLRVLLVEDNPRDAELITAELDRSGFAPRSPRVDTEAAYLRALEDGCDIILADYDLPNFNAPRALELLRQSGRDIPLIIVSGTIGEDTAVAAMKLGAADYLLKDRLLRLAPAIHQAIDQCRLRRERRQAEEELRESEKYYRSLFDNMLNGYAHCRMIFTGGQPRDFTFLQVNRAFESLTGLKDVAGKNVSDVIPGLYETDQELFEIYGRVALTGEPARFEQHVKALDMWFSIAVHSPRKEHFVAFFDVITERKQAEVALRQSEERYRLLFENNPLPMWLHDLETSRFLAVNESAVQNYGYTREEFLGMAIGQIRPPEDVSSSWTTTTEAADHAGPLATRHRRKDGTIIHAEIFSRPLVFAGRRARLVLSTDVTEKKLLEEKYLHAQRLESLGMLASGIAHDLNNMLAPIIFAAPMLRENASSPRDIKILNTLERSAERGAGLVRQILAFAQGTAGEPRLTQIKHLARDVISLVEETFPKSIRLDHQIASDAWPVIANPSQIHQVLLNLCVNARDAMPRGGTLTINAANRRLDSAEAQAIPGARPGAWLVIEITDTGSGISPEVLSRIWDPFFTTKDPGKGTGLGLSTVRGIVSGHLGFIELRTATGKGTTFRIFLPAAEADSRETAAATSASAAVAAVPRSYGDLILVVDDDQPIREIVAAILGKHGYRVVTCGDGAEAIALFTANSGAIALVVTDVDMPNLSGAGLAQLLRRLQPDVPLLAMSGLSGRDSGPDAGAIRELTDAFLLKPFSADDLLATVHRLLQSAGES